jgi:putative DNA primase/helicase
MSEKVSIIDAKERFQETEGDEATKRAAAPAYSEDALALAFTALHDGDLRHVAKWNKWLRWDGQRWAFDETWRVFDLARVICRETATRLDNSPSQARALTSAKTVAAIERLAKTDPRHATTTDQWDADPWLLNTPDGTIDLRSGDLFLHRRTDLITKTTEVGPRGGCPTWRGFLKRVTDGDEDLQAYLQRLLGYALTGSTREHVMAFLYGTGANGKSVLLSTVSGILGDYHRTAPIEAFTLTSSDRHPTEIAMLRGARLVTAVETEEGRRWAESRIKALTGGDQITARFMRQDFFEFTPQFKLLIAGNHKPSLRSVDEAIRRRLHLVPFTVTIPPEERDEELPERLKAEWAGILEWMIEGAVEWNEGGLQPPEAVKSATAEYLAAEDAMAIWIEERCNTGPAFRAGSTELYKSWRAYCEITGEQPGSQKRFSQNLESRGFEKGRLSTGRAGFLGIAPASTEEEDDVSRRWNLAG